MARKALDDARDVNIRLIRVSMPGFSPVVHSRTGDLDLWIKSPEAYWRRVAGMMDDLDGRNMRLVPVLMWNARQFPAIAGDTVGDLIRDEGSASWRLLSRYVSDFVRHFKDRKTIAFYELTNELNLGADLDNVKLCRRQRSKAECSLAANFSTDEMNAFVRRFAALVKTLDGSREISSGFSVPRASAEHLRARPGWSPSGPDWTLDTRAQFERNLKDIHQGVSIISIHLYDKPENRRFGASDAVELIAAAKRVADSERKKLFVGEFGDRQPDEAGPGSFSFRAIDALERLNVRYSAIWVWQFYQRKPYRSPGDPQIPFSLEPGHTDALIRRIAHANGADKASGPQRADVLPPRLVLTWPLECAFLGDEQTVHAIASDDSGKVERLELWMNGKRVGTDTAPPYDWRLQVGALRAGEHKIEIRAHDVVGNVATASRRVYVRDPGGARSCELALKRP